MSSNEKITLTVDYKLLNDWEERAKALGIRRNDYIRMMVHLGEESFRKGKSHL